MRRVRYASLVLAVCALALTSCGKLSVRKPAAGLLAKGPFAGALNAAGETPLWTLRIREKALVYTGADRQSVSFPNTGPEVSPEEAVWSAKTADGKSLKVTLTSKTCQDEATSLAYPMSATVETAGQNLKGCATKAGEGLGSRE